MQVNNKNNISFGAIKLPDYLTLSDAAKAVVREIDTKYKPQGIVYATLYLSCIEDDAMVHRELTRAKIPHIRVKDELLKDDAAKKAFSERVVLA